MSKPRYIPQDDPAAMSKAIEEYRESRELKKQVALLESQIEVVRQGWDLQWRVDGLLSDVIANTMILQTIATTTRGDYQKAALNTASVIWSGSTTRLKNFIVQYPVFDDLHTIILEWISGIQEAINAAMQGDGGQTLRDYLASFSREQWMHKIRIPEPKSGAPKGARAATLLIGKAALAEKARNNAATWVEVGYNLFKMWSAVPRHQQTKEMVGALNTLKRNLKVDDATGKAEKILNRDGLRTTITTAIKAYETHARQKN